MKRLVILCGGVVLAGASLLASGCAPKAATASAPASVERGKYLVTAMGCGDCHSPKQMGPQGPVEVESRLLSGHPEGTQLPPPPAPSGPWIASASGDQTAWAGPWGVSFATNLTPDENTGIGSWSEETFVQALKTGRHMGVARPILPPMPWTAMRHLSDEDLRSMYAYLRTIPPVHNRVPEPLPPAAPPVALPAAP
ncbi:MAG TPA: c-type cytochrome [Thermoanaerobaculia bacterium]|nr:c-type cytochrome [Thermoanaerobaculia bacterium]